MRLFTEHRMRLSGLAWSLMLNATDAEDVFQAASLILWQKFDDFKSGTNFMAWAGQVVLLKAQQLRRTRFRDKLSFGDAYSNAIEREALGKGIAVDAEKEELIALAACVGQLSKENQQMLHARYVEGADSERMGAMFNRSAVAVRIALSRIRRTLFDCVVGKVTRGDEKCQPTRKIQTTRNAKRGRLPR
jgi:RNA polymerase sigma-70 factor (ECF subfamily)